MKRITWITGIISLSLLILAGATYANRHVLKDWWINSNQTEVPTAVSFDDIADNTNNGITDDTDNTSDFTDDGNTNNNDNSNEGININDNANTNEANANVNADTNEEKPEIVIPESINLAIPFTSQAPHANWDLPYQEACEEASMLMSARFLQGRTIDGANDADAAILQLVDHATNVMKYPIDSTAQETANILEDFYKLDTELIYDFTWDDVKLALAQGYPVILPAAGRELGNPNFTSPGPIYHMLVIKGYTPSVVITNDPGTRKGADYQYSYDTLFNAAHDWNGGNVNEGKKVIIIVKPKTDE